MVRNIAIQRPQQLANICQENQFSIVTSFFTLTRELQKISDVNIGEEKIVHHGLTHKEATIQSQVEIFYAFIYTDPDFIDLMVKYMVDLLLDKDPLVSHSAKYALIRLLRPKLKRNMRKVLIEPGTPQCQTPTPQAPTTQPEERIEDVDMIEPLGLVAGAADNEPSLEALLGMAAGKKIF